MIQLAIREQRKPVADVDDFAILIARMNFLLGRIAAVPLFKDAKIGFTEWLALSMVRQHDGIGNKNLAKLLGVTRQRAQQLVAGFASEGMVTVRVSMADSRNNEISLTPIGAERLRALNAELSSMLLTALGTKVRMLNKLQGNLALVTNAVAAAQLPGDHPPSPIGQSAQSSNAASEIHRLPEKQRA